jgi:hypothetical protein
VPAPSGGGTINEEAATKRLMNECGNISRAGRREPQAGGFAWGSEITLWNFLRSAFSRFPIKQTPQAGSAALRLNVNLGCF